MLTPSQISQYRSTFGINTSTPTQTKQPHAGLDTLNTGDFMKSLYSNSQPKTDTPSMQNAVANANPQHTADRQAQAKSLGIPTVENDTRNTGINQGISANILPTIKEGVTNYSKNVGNDYMQNTKDMLDTGVQIDTGQKSHLEGNLQNAGTFINSIFAPITEAIKPSINQAANGLENNKTFSNVANSGTGDTIAKAQQAMSDWSEKHPDASKDLSSIMNIAALFTGPEAETTTQGAIKGATNAIGDTVTNAVEGVSKIPGQIADTAGEAINNTKDLGNQTIQKVQNAATPMDESVKTELTKPSIKPYQAQASVTKYTQAAEEAMKDNSKPTPMELAGQRGEDALSNINSQIKTAGAQKTALTTGLGNQPVGDIVSNAASSIRRQVMERLGGMFTKDGEILNAPGRISKIPSGEDTSLLKTVVGKIDSATKNPTFQKVDDLIDFIQNKLYERSGIGSQPVNSEVKGILKSVTGDLNSKLKEIGGDTYKKLNSKLSELMDTREDLNKGLGTDTNKGAALMKSLFSPNGTMAKGLFAKIQKLTGIDLVHEATIAKWAMENAGDVRQSSLLKQVLGGDIKGKSGLLKGLIEKGYEKLQNPEGKATSIIKENAGLNKENPIVSGVKNFVKNPKMGLSIEDVGAKELELGKKINELNKQWVEKPTIANKKALDNAKTLYKTIINK